MGGAFGSREVVRHLEMDTKLLRQGREVTGHLVKDAPLVVASRQTRGDEAQRVNENDLGVQRLGAAPDVTEDRLEGPFRGLRVEQLDVPGAEDLAAHRPHRVVGPGLHVQPVGDVDGEEPDVPPGILEAHVRDPGALAHHQVVLQLAMAVVLPSPVPAT